MSASGLTWSSRSCRRRTADSTLVELSCIDDDVLVATVEVPCEREIGAEVVQGEACEPIAKRGFASATVTVYFLIARRNQGLTSFEIWNLENHNE